MPLIVQNGANSPLKFKPINQASANNELTLAKYSEGVNKIHYISLTNTDIVMGLDNVPISFWTDIDLDFPKHEVENTAFPSPNKVKFLKSTSSGVFTDETSVTALPNRFAIIVASGYHFQGFIIYS